MPETIDFNLYSNPVTVKFIFKNLTCEEGRKRESSKTSLGTFDFIVFTLRALKNVYSILIISTTDLRTF